MGKQTPEDYEDLRVLLLYEPLQVLVQSMPTDWKALRFNAWTNFFGAGVDALIGGWDW